MEKELQNRVFQLIADNLNIDKEDISAASRIEDLSEDSIQLFGLIIVFEREFNHKIFYEDLMKIETVGDIINYIKNRI